MIPDGIGEIVVLAFRGDRLVAAGQSDGVEVVRRAMDDAVIALEAALQRPIVLRLVHRRHVPFPRHRGSIPRAAEHLRDRLAVRTEIVGVARSRACLIHHVAHTGLMRIESGQQAGPRRTTTHAIVELSESNSARCQPVEIRRIDGRAVNAKIREPHIIGQDQHYIRAALSLPGQRETARRGNRPKKIAACKFHV